MNWGVDWRTLFVPSGSVTQIFVRGTVMYLMLFLLMRLMPRRQSGNFALPDLLLVVLVADAAQNGMAGEYRSVTEGVLLVATLIAWNYALDWLGYRYKSVGRLIFPRPIPLVENGRMLRANMRRELVTPEELSARLREEGADEVGRVKAAYLEGDGQISVVLSDGDGRQGRADRAFP